MGSSSFVATRDLDESNLASKDLAERRAKGMTYTPPPIIEAMIRWSKSHRAPRRVVDPGAGSGRFTIAAARAFPDAEIVAIENDQASAHTLRANIRAMGLASRIQVVEQDYRSVTLRPIEGPTLFIGNPPYVRHHDIEPRWKDWYAASAARLGVSASRLAGLHLHFLLKTRELARPGDFGCMITAAEWLDVNYGSTLRTLLTNGMGCVALDVFPADQRAFPDVMTTAVIVSFDIEAEVFGVRAGTIGSEGGHLSLGGGAPIDVTRLAGSSRWSALAAGGDEGFDDDPERHRVGNLFRVSRGQVTGANAIWSSAPWASYLDARFSRPTVTRAAELIRHQPLLTEAASLRRVIDLPEDLTRIRRQDRGQVDRFLEWARSEGAHEGYVATHRAAWWAIGLYEPAPILVTYMGRRDPVFVRNLCGARHLNIAHGLYPRRRLAPSTLDRIVTWLNTNVRRSNGRTYSGGLTKFEPREVERLPLPEQLGLV